MGDRTNAAFEAAVEKGRKLVKRLSRTKWELGDLILSVIPMGTDKANNNSQERIRVFADATGLTETQVERYRNVAHAYPPEERLPGVSFGTHQNATTHKAELEQLYAEHLEGGPLPNIRLLRERAGLASKDLALTPEQVRKAILESDEVAEIADEAVMDKRMAAYQEQEAERQAARTPEQREERERRREEMREMVAEESWMAVAFKLTDARRHLREAMRLAVALVGHGGWTGVATADRASEDVERVRERAAKLAVLASTFADFMSADEMDLDAALSKILEGES